MSAAGGPLQEVEMTARLGRLLAGVLVLGVLVLPAPTSGDEPAGPRSYRFVVKLRPSLAFEAERVLGRAAPPSDAAAEHLQSFLRRHGGTELQPVHAGRLRLRGSRGIADRDLTLQTSRRFAARSARRFGPFQPPDLSRSYVLVVPLSSPAAAQSLLDALARDPELEYAEEDTPLSASLVPDDPYYASAGSWGQAYDDLYGLKRIGADAAWDAATGAGVTAAVIDTGVDDSHVELVNRIWSNAGEVPGNGVDDDRNGYVDDIRGWDFIGASADRPVAGRRPA